MGPKKLLVGASDSFAIQARKTTHKYSESSVELEEHVDSELPFLKTSHPCCEIVYNERSTRQYKSLNQDASLP
jgi:hypothetical protein